MPFVSRNFTLSSPMPAYLFVMQTLNINQAQAQRFIHKGCMEINGQALTKTGERICGEITLRVFEPEKRPYDMFAPLVDDDDILVFEKPSGILVHPNTRIAPFSMLDVVRWYGGKDANIVHRIDKETSGLLVASKHKKAEIELKNSFQDRKVFKRYYAWVDGEIKDSFSVSEPLSKNDSFESLKHKALLDPLGKPSHTDFKPIYYDPMIDATLLECIPLTGRMHQIRVHLFHVKHPILGDPLYATSFKISNEYLDGRLSQEKRKLFTGASRLMLHAQKIEFLYGEKRFSIESKINFDKMKYLISSQRILEK